MPLGLFRETGGEPFASPQDPADNPCGIPAAQEARWDAEAKAWWVADALMERLAQASTQPLAVAEPQWGERVIEARRWLRKELASPRRRRDLEGPAKAVMEVARSQVARDALRALGPQDALRAWQEGQAGQRCGQSGGGRCGKVGGGVGGGGLQVGLVGHAGSYWSCWRW
jgi:hypothetical protein